MLVSCSSILSVSNVSERAAVGVEGPGVAGVEAVVMMGVR